MPIPQVLPKFELKELFESGDLITEATLDQFIDASYNHTLVGGANVTLTSVSGPSGTTITINSSSGGGTGTVTSASNIGAGTGLFNALIGTDLQFKSLVAGSNIAITNTGTEVTIAATSSGTTYQGGDGINIDTTTAPDTIAIDLYTTGCAPEGPNLEFTSNKLNFKGLHIRDEGTAVGSFQTINFIGSDVLAQTSGDPCVVDVYIPPPTFASHYNTTDGTTTATVIESGMSRYNLRISSPTSEGNPYKTNGWAATVNSCASDPTVNIQPGQGATNLVTGFSATGAGDATLKVEVFDADGTTVLATYTTTTLFQNAIFNSSGANAGITITITNYQADTSKWKANIATAVNAGTIFTTNGLDGGRYHIKTTMDTDTTTDSNGTYTYTQSDVFYDTGSSIVPTVASIAITESTLLTKHLSGVEYYRLNSTFDVQVNTIDTLNPNTQGRNFASVYNLSITGSEYGLQSYNIPLWSPQVGAAAGWNNTYNTNGIGFNWTAWPITSTNYRYRGASANGTATPFHPWGNGSIVNSPNQNILIDTVTLAATNLGESFNDETERLFRNGSAYASWVSTTALVNNTPNYGYIAGTFSEACCVGSYLVRADKYFLTDPSTSTIQPNLTAYKPDSLGANPDYTGLTNSAFYSRQFYTSASTAISNFKLTFGGDAGASGNWGAALAASNLKIYVRRVATSTGGATGYAANPLSVHGTAFNSATWNDAADGPDTASAASRSVTNTNDVTVTFATKNCITGFWLDILIVDPTIEIQVINCELLFFNGTSETNAVA